MEAEGDDEGEFKVINPLWLEGTDKKYREKKKKKKYRKS